MPLEAPLPSAAERAAELNVRYRHHAVADVLWAALRDPSVGRVALVSSFGAESVVLLHLLSQADRTTPVLFLDTEVLFPETLDYQLSLARYLGLKDVRRLRPDPRRLAERDPQGILHTTDPDACCALRKTETLEAALEPFDAWITGRKRFQSASRRSLKLFETDRENRIKINPLAKWTPATLNDYIANNRLPRHPLVAQGYPSIGCAPCTSPVIEDEDARAGRWRQTEKTECGIHFENGVTVRRPVETQT